VRFEPSNSIIVPAARGSGHACLLWADAGSCTDDPDYQAWSVLISPFCEIPRQKVFFVRLMRRGSDERRKARNAGYDAVRPPGGIRVTAKRELLVLLSTHQRRM